METKVAVIGIIVENKESVPKLNALLSEYGDYIIGRMGVPYHKKGISVISIVIDAEQDTINTLTGAIGRLDGVQAKTAYSKK
jgi:putative iron-only hydrogenase system regulator